MSAPSNPSHSPLGSNGVFTQVQSEHASKGSVVQHFPALLTPNEHDPTSYPFGKIQLPATGVFFATALTYVNVNQSPLMPGHILVMPRSNIARVKDLGPLELTDLWLVAQYVAQVFEVKFKAEAMTFAIQDGVEAGQKIPCVHIHIIPRHREDLVRKDDIYDLLEANVPASMMAVASDGMPHHHESTQASPVKTEAAAASESASSEHPIRESLDDERRVIRSRAEQAAEAVKFANWLKEAGLPKWLQ